ncbi:outer membrane beta-barrel protein [Candidatus Palauibacter sp.]|uniref:outer membrane beta-barrel protein n=1 Tax=Candidatus Palauibacter sp. TaxID=3101350 RepID=UPI003B5258E1
MNRRFVCLCFVVPVLLFGLTAPLASQGISFGAAASYGEDSDFGVGPRVSLAIPAGDLGLSLVGSFDYFFPSDAEADAIGAEINYWELNGNVVLDISVGGTVAPYAGAGINYVEASGSVSAGGISISTSESEVGANLLAGLRFGSAGPSPFLEGRYSTASEQIVVAVGLMF